MFSISQVSGLVENFNIGIYSDTINVINVNLCMISLLIELYLFIPLFWTFTKLQSHSTVDQCSLKCCVLIQLSRNN